MRFFSHKEDLIMINEWLKDRNQEGLKKENLPRIGLIEDHTAVGFLCQTDSSVCFLDPVITNPKIRSVVRHEALNEIIYNLVKLGENLGFKRCLFMTFEESLLKRGEELDFLITQIGFGFKEL
jgi:hypothetical protein